ncbi:MAG: aminotransferase class I/II-fold pyridoxal phosphate-dependent enzyme [Pseudomonadota bacterium]
MKANSPGFGNATPRIHGGPDQYGVPLHDFSTNSNACGPCPDALDAVREADAQTYPDPGYRQLRAQLASFHAVAPERIVLAASGSEFIFRMTAAIAGMHGRSAASVYLPAHGFGDYAQAAAAHGLATSGNAPTAQLRWVCEPSSPVGGLDSGLAGLAASGFCTVLDRAYEPLRLQGQMALTRAQLGKVWQLWTPNKALGLTGIRAAYAVVPAADDAQALVQELERLCPSWPVGVHGVALLMQWTRPQVQQWLAETVVTLAAWKRRQIELCIALGWEVLPGVANFFCARPALPPGLTLADALMKLRQQGIKLRDCASFGLPGMVRLSVQSPQAQDALHNAWQSMVLTESGGKTS